AITPTTQHTPPLAVAKQHDRQSDRGRNNMYRLFRLGRTTAVDTAEVGDDTSAAPTAEIPEDTERSAAEFGGAPSGPSNGDRGDAAAAAGVHRGRSIQRSRLPTSRGNTAAAALASDEPGPGADASAESNYDEEEMTRLTDEFIAEAAAVEARMQRRGRTTAAAARTPGDLVARRSALSADEPRSRHDNIFAGEDREGEAMRTDGSIQREDHAQAGAATRRSATSQVSLREPLEGLDDPSDGANRRPPPPHSFDESLNVSRIGQHRAHNDADTEGSWSLQEGEENDDLDTRADGQWREVADETVTFTVNGAKAKQVVRLQRGVDSDQKTVLHIIRYPPTQSGGCRQLFSRTGICDASQLYDEDYSQTHPIDHLMEKAEYYACWDEISKQDLPPSSSSGANLQTPFWEAVESTLNQMLRKIVIIGRDGEQLYLLDDDKFHFESHPSKHRHLNLRILKHTRDNRWGMVMDTLCVPALLMPADIRTHRKGAKQVDTTRHQLFGSAFGSDPQTVPDLSGVHIMMDRGYSMEKQHQETLAPSKVDSTCSTARALTLAYNYGQTKKPNDSRTYVAERGIASLQLSQKTTHGRRIVCGAWSTGTGGVVLFQSSKFRHYDMDGVAQNERMGRLWKDSPRNIEVLGFKLEQSILGTRTQQRDEHKLFYQEFKRLQIEQVTIASGSREWHIGRSNSLSSKQCYTQVCVLKRHFMDLAHPCVQKLFEFMYKGYNKQEREQEKQRSDDAADAQTSQADENEVEFDRDIAELVRVSNLSSDGPRNGNVVDSVRLDLLSFNESDAELSERIRTLKSKTENAPVEYLNEFLRQVGHSLTASSNKSVLLGRVNKWIQAKPEEQCYILKSLSDLQSVYERKTGQPHAPSWTRAKIIEKILAHEDEGPEEEASFEQDIMDAVVGNSSLTPLADKAKENCAKGHEMEGEYCKELIRNAHQFPFGELREISSLGVVQKKHKRHAKTSVDRLIGVVAESEGGSESRGLLPAEFKARVVQSTVQKEEDRIHDLRRKGLMSENSIYFEMDSNSQHSFLGIKKPDERLQALHHAYVLGLSNCLHAVGNTRKLMSVCNMKFDDDLLEAYGQVIDLLYDSGLKIFYRGGNDDGITANEEEMSRIRTAVEKNAKYFVDFKRFEFNYRLWRAATAPNNLPLPPLKSILPQALAWWNVNKPVGDMITQMLWEYNYHPPTNTPQSAMVKRLAHQMPMYMIHRLFQLFSTSRPLTDFSSLLHFREYTRKKYPFWKSIYHQETILAALARRYDPERPLGPAAEEEVQQEDVDIPEGVSSMPLMHPVTGSTPKKRIRGYYANQSNSHKLPYQRRHCCLGYSVVQVCDQEGQLVSRRCAQCGDPGASWWCTQCHVYLHGLPRKPRTADGRLELMATPRNKRDARGELIFARQTCSHKWHRVAREAMASHLSDTSVVCPIVQNFTPMSNLIPQLNPMSGPNSITNSS
ncbi:hypothetical protein THAOC_07177, partial [Thalassiosira oceanica]